MRSLRFRLPALFLVAVVVAGVVTALIAVRLFQDYTRDQTLRELRRQASGLAALYAAQALASVSEGKKAPAFAAEKLERATGARLYYVGPSIFPGQISGLRQLDESSVDWEALNAGRAVTFDLVPQDDDREYLAVAHPLKLEGETFGGLVVAKPATQLQERWLVLMRRVGLALLGGIVAAAALAWYLSRRVTRPVLSLSEAMDAVAERRYDVRIQDIPSGDEIGHLAGRFREMTQRLAESEELERNFLMRVSHELRTPLTAIRGHVDALREGLADDAEAREASLEVIAREAERLSRLVGDVLDLAKLDARRFTLLEEEVDLGRLLDQAYLSFGEQARARGILYERRIVDAPVIHSDGDRVLQIVSNLLANAFQWTPDGGRVQLSAESRNGEIRVAVQDSGPGIAPEEAETIFRPFISQNGGGTGLGLAIAGELAQALGGRLLLDSQVGRGSRFELVLPRS